MTKVVWSLELEKETKGTYMYRDPDNRKHTLYVPKGELGKKQPETIKVTIEAA